MKERFKPASKNSSITLDQIFFPTERLGNIPLEPLFKLGTKWSRNKQTKTGRSNAVELLGKEGLIILDAHFDPFGMPVTGASLLKEFKRNGTRVGKIVIPISIKTRKDPRLSNFYSGIEENVKGFDFYITRRKDVFEDEKELFSDMTNEEVNEGNYEYVEVAEQILEEPGSIVCLAAYGGMNPPKGYTPKGIARVLRTGKPAICTMSVKARVAKLPFTSFMSDKILRFDSDSTNEEMYRKITAEHKNIAPRNRFVPGYFD